MQRIWMAARKEELFFCVTGNDTAPAFEVKEGVLNEMP